MGLRLCRHKVLGTSPFFIIHGMDPSIPVPSGAPWRMDDWDLQPTDVLAYAWALATKIQTIHADARDKLLRGDEEYKRYFDRRKKFVGVFSSG